MPEYPTKLGGGESAQTSISREVLKRIADSHVTAPEGFTVHPKVQPQLQRRAAAITDGPIDWGTAEILALGSLLMQGRPVRLSFHRPPNPQALEERIDREIPDALYVDDVHGAPQWRKRVTRVLAEEIREELSGDPAP